MVGGPQSIGKNLASDSSRAQFVSLFGQIQLDRRDSAGPQEFIPGVDIVSCPDQVNQLVIELIECLFEDKSALLNNPHRIHG